MVARENLPRPVQEPVAAPQSRCGYPVRFTKGITGLSLAVEGLLVKHITKFLTLSLPDRTQFMTIVGRPAQRDPPSRPWSACREPLESAGAGPAGPDRGPPRAGRAGQISYIWTFSEGPTAGAESGRATGSEDDYMDDYIKER